MSTSKDAASNGGPGAATAVKVPKHSSPDLDDINLDEIDPKDVQALYTVFHAEADKLAAGGLFTEAIDKYNRALKFHPNQLDCLVNRARCHMMMGDTPSSLKDVDQVLSLSPEFIRAVYQKAETLYARGDFEDALVLFHRGKKARPELVGFDIGIHKSIEAIRSAVVLLDTAKIRRDMDEAARSKKIQSAGIVPGLPKKATATDRSGNNVANRKGGATAAAAAAAVAQLVKKDATQLQLERNLIEELQDDKLFLQDMLEDSRLMQACDGEIEGLVRGGLEYIEKRVEFWRQGNPNGAATAVVKKAVLGSRLNLAAEEIEGLTQAAALHSHKAKKATPKAKALTSRSN
ncbi:Tetratricopeptide repeat protein 25 [Chytriomyces hyalinus]|nr:Tetratricopeptide repeat protein 25 [Chytriomyces hyalinus]